MHDHDLRIWRAIDAVERDCPFADHLGPDYRHGMFHIARELLRYVSPEQSRLLDIGCGPMAKTAVFQKLGFACSAVDDLDDPWHRRSDNTERIKSFARQMGIDFRPSHVGDGESPFVNERFDVVTCFGVIEHLHESPRGLLNVAGRCLKPGGILVITMPNSVNLRKRIAVAAGRTNYPPIDQFYHGVGTWRGHVREYTLHETIAICRYSGFEVLSATTFEGLAYRQLHGLARHVYFAVAALVPRIRSGLCVLSRRPETWRPVEADDGQCREVERS